MKIETVYLILSLFDKFKKNIDMWQTTNNKALKYRIRYMIPEFKHSEYGKIFGNLMDLPEATSHGLHPIGQYKG